MALNKILHECGCPLLVQTLMEVDDDSMGRGNGALRRSVSPAHARLGCTTRLDLKPGTQAAIRARLAQAPQAPGPGTVAD